MASQLLPQGDKMMTSLLWMSFRLLGSSSCWAVPQNHVGVMLDHS